MAFPFIHVTFAVAFDLLSENNICHTFWTVWGRAFIFHMCFPCDKAFPIITKVLPLGPWPWPLTYISGILKFAFTFELLEAGLSYFICTFLVIIFFRSYQKFWPCNLYHNLWPTYLKTLTVAIALEPLPVRFSYLTTCTFFVIKHFLSYQNFGPAWLWMWPLTYISENLKWKKNPPILSIALVLTLIICWIICVYWYDNLQFYSSYFWVSVMYLIFIVITIFQIASVPQSTTHSVELMDKHTEIHAKQIASKQPIPNQSGLNLIFCL